MFVSNSGDDAAYDVNEYRCWCKVENRILIYPPYRPGQVRGHFSFERAANSNQLLQNQNGRFGLRAELRLFLP